jgi:transposase
VVSIADKTGCMPQIQHEWVKKAEVNAGKRAGVPSDVAGLVKALEREDRELR